VLWEAVAVAEADADWLGETDWLRVEDCVRLGVPDCDDDSDWDGVALREGLWLWVRLSDAVRLALLEGLGEVLMLGVPVALEVPLTLGEPVKEAVCDCERDSDWDGVRVTLGVDDSLLL